MGCWETSGERQRRFAPGHFYRRIRRGSRAIAHWRVLIDPEGILSGCRYPAAGFLLANEEAPELVNRGFLYCRRSMCGGDDPTPKIIFQLSPP